MNISLMVTELCSVKEANKMFEKIIKEETNKKETLILLSNTSFWYNT